MKKAQRTDFFREIRKTLSRYISILFIVALGVAFFSGLRSSETDMRLSVDAVGDESNFMDIRIISTLGLTDDDIAAIAAVDGVTDVEGEYSFDAIWDFEDSSYVVEVSSLTDTVNIVTITEGRLPETSGECFMDWELLEMTGYEVGDTITLKSGTDDDIYDTLNEVTYTIVGAGSTPTYLSLTRGTASIGNGDVAGFIMILEEDFALDVYTQIYVVSDDLDQYLTGSDEYQAAVDELTEAIEAIADERCQARYDEVVAEAEQQIADAEAELADALQELEDAQAEIDDGWAELYDAQTELADAQAEVDDAQAQIDENEATIISSEEELAEAQAALDAAQAELDAGLIEYNEGYAEYLAGLAEYEAGYAEYSAALEQYNESYAQYEEGLAEYEDGLDEYEDGQETLETLTSLLSALEEVCEAAGIDPYSYDAYVEQLEEVTQLQTALAEMSQQLAELKAELEASQEELEAAEAELAAAEAELADAKAQLDDAKAQLDDAKAELDAAKVELAQGQAELAAAYAQIVSGQAEIDSSQATIDSASEELEAGKEELEDAKEELAAAQAEIDEGSAELADAQAELEDGEAELAEAWEEYYEAKEEADAEIADARAELADIEVPTWYVLDRQSISSWVEYDTNASSMGAIAMVFPIIFFFVAALIALTTMTRMIDEKRTEIGTMKALGYSTAAIASKYILYALSATLIGSIIGVLIGEKLFPWVVITAFKILYTNLTIMCIPYNLFQGVLASGIAVLCTVGATIAACWKTTRSNPAELMRPVAPIKGKKILLEKIPFLWKHLSFSWKSSLRNLFRYKKRLFMTLFGIGASMGLIVVGFGINDSVMVIADYQYGVLWKYEATLTLDSSADADDIETLEAELEADDDIEDILFGYTSSLELEYEGQTKDVYIIVPENTQDFYEFFLLCDMDTGEEYKLVDEGVIVSQKVADSFGIEAGDEITLMDDDNNAVTVTVAAVTEHYVYHYIYMTPALYEELFDEEPESNVVYMMVDDDVDQDKLASRMLTYTAVTGVSLMDDMSRSIDDMLSSLSLITYVLVISAGLLAFVVLYNLNNVNISERRRELATIKLLGFYDPELAMYVYRENILLSVIGVVIGVFMGKYITVFIMNVINVDVLMFGNEIRLVSYIYSMLITVAFVVLVNGVMYFSLKKIDMVSSLKSVE